MATRKFLFSSEHVTEGHPDKMADQVSDAVLDACLREDPNAKVACETAFKTGMCFVFGEITTSVHLDYQAVCRAAIKDIGFDDSAKGFDYKTCALLVSIEQQSPEIGSSVHGGGARDDSPDLGAGDQGLMFGYAVRESPTLMPMSYELARQLAQRLSECWRTGVLPWVRPDGKTQVTMEYEKDEATGRITPLRVHTVVISTQHAPDVTIEQIREGLMKEVVAPVIPADMRRDTIYHLNPSGSFVTGGPMGDAGLTGRKIIVDTYGGWGAHGGGAFSGKDPSKVDRSAAYGARWIAKSLVAAGVCDRVLVQLSYSIGVAEPLNMCVETYGTGAYSDADIEAIVKANFRMRPYDFISALRLRRPIYSKTARFGHFGREDPDFTWETPKPLTIPEGLTKLR